MEGWLTITLQGKVISSQVKIVEGEPRIVQTWIEIRDIVLKDLVGGLKVGFSNIFSSAEKMQEKFKEVFNRDNEPKTHYTLFIRGELPMQIEMGDIIALTFDKEVISGIMHRIFKDDLPFFLTSVLFPYRIAKIRNGKEVASVNIDQKERYHHNWIKKQGEGYPFQKCDFTGSHDPSRSL